MVSCCNTKTLSILFTFVFIPGMLFAQSNASAPSASHGEIIDPMKLVEEAEVPFTETERTFREEKFKGLKKYYSTLEGIVMVGVTSEQGEVLLRGPDDWVPPGGPVKQGEGWVSSARNIIEQQTGLAIENEEAVLVEKMNFYQKDNQDAHFSGLILHLQASLSNKNNGEIAPDFKWFSKVPKDAHPNHIEHIELYLNH